MAKEVLSSDYSELDNVYASFTLSLSCIQNSRPVSAVPSPHRSCAVHDALKLDVNSQQDPATSCLARLETAMHEPVTFLADNDVTDRGQDLQLSESEEQDVDILLTFWHPTTERIAPRYSATGLFEASMPVLRWPWRERRTVAGKATNTPNIICGPRQIGRHKFGHHFVVEHQEISLVTSGTASREAMALTKEMFCNQGYLGSGVPDISLKFFRPGGQITTQYYNFLRLGDGDHTKIHNSCYSTTKNMACETKTPGPFEIISDREHQKGSPARAWKTNPFTGYHRPYDDEADRRSPPVCQALIHVQNHPFSMSLTEKEGAGFNHS